MTNTNMSPYILKIRTKNLLDNLKDEAKKNNMHLELIINR